MLIGEYRRRNKHRHLFAVGSGLESGTHRHFGLAETHIATDETVHRTGTLHVGLHILCGLQLVRCVLIEEAGLEFVLQIGIGTEGEALLTAALGIESYQVAGNILDMLFRSLLQALPLACAKGGETGRLAIVLRLVFRYLIK